eukprot:1017954-Alexandrium_andersonii.AAC.1
MGLSWSASVRPSLSMRLVRDTRKDSGKAPQSSTFSNNLANKAKLARGNAPNSPADQESEPRPKPWRLLATL